MSTTVTDTFNTADMDNHTCTYSGKCTRKRPTSILCYNPTYARRSNSEAFWAYELHNHTYIQTDRCEIGNTANTCNSDIESFSVSVNRRNDEDANFRLVTEILSFNMLTQNYQFVGTSRQTPVSQQD